MTPPGSYLLPGCDPSQAVTVGHESWWTWGRGSGSELLPFIGSSPSSLNEKHVASVQNSGVFECRPAHIWSWFVQQSPGAGRKGPRGAGGVKGVFFFLWEI